jgi:hypothetical protein
MERSIIARKRVYCQRFTLIGGIRRRRQPSMPNRWRRNDRAPVPPADRRPHLSGGEKRGNAPMDEVGDPREAVWKRTALAALLDTWDGLLKQGIPAEVLATTVIYLALTDMIDAHGEAAVLEIVERLPERVRAGDFTLSNGG